VTETGQAADAWKQAFAADRPVVVEAVVESTPMLPPLMPDAKADKVFAALAQEGGASADDDRVRRQLAAERDE
jgi:pyruvate dehydrogenase (quinone)